jgi:hypothetical protein
MALSKKKTLYLVLSEDNSREYTIDFPDTGKMLDIELMKIQISDNKYDTLKFSFNTMFVRQALRIDTISTFVILLPELKKDLNTNSFLRLPFEQMSLLEAMYEEQFLPWYEEWLVVLNKPKETKEDKEKREEEEQKKEA